LSSLESVGSDWMDGREGGFSSMTSIYVGSKSYPTSVGDYFCDSWSTSGTIYGLQASSWQKGGISGWGTAS